MSRSRKGQRHERSADEPAPAPRSPSSSPDKKRAAPSRTYAWHPAARALASALIVLHVTGVFFAPWSLSTRPALPPGYIPVDQEGTPHPEWPPPPPGHPDWQPAPLIYGVSGALQWYVNLLYINHGYEFFAPDPAPSQLARFVLYDQSDGEIATIELPNRDQQRPRLFYHRHMMLAAQAEDPRIAELGAHRLYAQHLLRTHEGASRVHVERRIHFLLSPQQASPPPPEEGAPPLKPVELTDPKYYATVDEFDVYAHELQPPADAAAPIPGVSP